MSQIVLVAACVIGLASPAPKAVVPSPPPILQPDALDKPAPVAAAAAERAAQQIRGMHHMDHGSYSHVDAGRAPASPSPKPAPAHEHHR
jgi:hypothetical protein